MIAPVPVPREIDSTSGDIADAVSICGPNERWALNVNLYGLYSGRGSEQATHSLS